MRMIYPQPNLWLLVFCASMSSLQMVSAIALNFQPCSTNQEKTPCGHIGCKCLFNKAMVKFNYFKYILASVSQKYGKPFQRQQIELRIGFVSVLIDPFTLILQISSYLSLQIPLERFFQLCPFCLPVFSEGAVGFTFGLKSWEYSLFLSWSWNKESLTSPPPSIWSSYSQFNMISRIRNITSPLKLHVCLNSIKSVINHATLSSEFCYEMSLSQQLHLYQGTQYSCLCCTF